MSPSLLGNCQWNLTREIQSVFTVEILILETTTINSHKHPTSPFLADIYTNSHSDAKRNIHVFIVLVLTILPTALLFQKCYNDCALTAWLITRAHSANQRTIAVAAKHKYHTSCFTDVESKSSPKQPQVPPTIVPLPTFEITTQHQLHCGCHCLLYLTRHSNNRKMCLLKTAVATVSNSDHLDEANL